MTVKIRAGVIKRIHVNQHNIRSNVRRGTDLPVITVKTSAKNVKGFEARWDGPSKLVWSPDKPLACGARLWVETLAEVEVFLTQDVGKRPSSNLLIDIFPVDWAPADVSS